MSPHAAETREAFEQFLDHGARGRDWPAWAGLFTDDAVYTEHCMGQFRGADSIAAWIRSAMEPVACMTFSVEWCVVEGDMLAFWIWNHLPAPAGSGDEFCFPNLSVLTYAGDGLWSAEEDFYEPAWTACVIDWFEQGGASTMNPDLSLVPRTPSHPAAPREGAARSQVSAALRVAAPPESVLRHEVVESAVGVGVFDTPERAYAVVVHVDDAGTVVYSDVITNPTETTNPCR
jgi:hypothetical protein